MRAKFVTPRFPLRQLLVALCGLYLLYLTGLGLGERLTSGQGWSSPEQSKRQLLQNEAVEASLAAADVEYAISAPALTSGFRAKAGPTKLQFWTPANRSERHSDFTRWIRQTGSDPDVELSETAQGQLRLRNLPPLYPNCQILVNHRYKFIYLRHPKSASSSIMVYFGTCPASEQSKSTDAAGSGSSGEGEGDAAQQVSAEVPLGRGAACLEPLVTAEISPEEILRMWEEYFVFTVVRNPYQRLLSSYKYLLRKTRADPNCPMVRWDDFCADPMALGRMCQARRACCPLPAGFYWHHAIDQGRCLETESGGWSPDYIATVERFDEQVQEIIMEIDRRRAPGLPPLAEVTGPLSKQNEARGAQTCQEEELDPAQLQPEKTRVLVAGQWIPYNATVLLDRYCNSADYFRGPHEHCLLRTRHFYATDFNRLYSQQQRLDP